MENKYTQHAEFEPSKLEQYETCPASWILGRDIEQESSEAAIRGTYLHGLMAELADDEAKTLKKWDGLSASDISIEDGAITPAEYDMLILCYEHLKDIAPIKDWKFERKVTLLDDFFNVITWGTVDAHCVIDKTVTVVDFKFGGTPVSAKDNLQLQVYAAGLMSEYTCNSSINYIFQPMRKSFNYDTIGNSGCHKMRRRLYSIMERCREEQVIFKVNDKCNWCNFNTQCPVLAKKKGSLMVRDKSEALTADTLQKLLPVAKQAKKEAEYIIKEAKSLLISNKECIPGWTVTATQGRREVADANSVYEFCAEILDKDTIMQYCNFTLGKLEKEYVAAFKEKFGGTLKDAKASFNEGINAYCKRKSDTITLKQK